MKTILVLAFAAIASPALAHEGPRVWIDTVGGKIKTYTSDNDLNPTTYTESRIFPTDLENVSGIFTTDFPGYEVRRTGGSVASGTTFSFNITGPLLYFDSANNRFITVQTSFGSPGPAPQLAISLSETFVITGNGPTAGFNFYTFNQVGDHSHLTYTFLGDGQTASDGPVGVYVLQMNINSAGLATSDTFYLIVGKEVEQTDPEFLSAVSAAQATLLNPGDMNCSGALELVDVSGFVQALIDPAGYGSSHPGCNIYQADFNRDGSVDGRDTQLFVRALAP